MRVGQRIRLLADLDDPFKVMPAGSTGTITFVDGLGTLHVKWDNGSQIGVIPEIDKYEVIETPGREFHEPSCVIEHQGGDCFP